MAIVQKRLCSEGEAEEQEKVIYRLEMHIKHANLSNDNLAVVNKADMQTVLNMLKKKMKR